MTLMALLGFVAPFLPDVFGFARQWLDHRQELDMMRLRHEQASDAASWRLEEIETQAAAEDRKAARQPHKSYGVQLLDKAAESHGSVWKWAFNAVFVAFSFLDWLIASVRPVITYWAFGLYALVKMANLAAVQQITGDVWGTLNNEAAWSQFDKDMLSTLIGFWFGERVRNGGRSGKRA